MILWFHYMQKRQLTTLNGPICSYTTNLHIKKKITNGFLSSSVGRGTRKDCPLSPLICSSNWTVIRSYKNKYQHLWVNGHKQPTQHNPETSIPALIDTTYRLRIFSGYRINFNKSGAMPLGGLKQIPSTLPSFSFQMVSWRLGILGYKCYPFLWADV